MSSEGVNTELMNVFKFYRRNGSVYKIYDNLNSTTKYVVANPHVSPHSLEPCGAFIAFSDEELQTDLLKNVFESSLALEAGFTNLDCLVQLMRSWYHYFGIESEKGIDLDALCRLFFNGVSLSRICNSEDWRSIVINGEMDEEEEESEIAEGGEQEANVAAVVFLDNTPCPADNVPPVLSRKRGRGGKKKIKISPSSKVRRKMTFADVGTGSDEDCFPVPFVSENGANEAENGAKEEDKRGGKRQIPPKNTLRAKVMQLETSLKEVDGAFSRIVADLRSDFQVLSDNVHAKLDSGFNNLNESIVAVSEKKNHTPSPSKDV